MSENQILQVFQQENSSKTVTKRSYREKVWEHLVKNKIASFPGPYGRIPNFKGAAQAAEKLLELEEFKLAKSVEVNPDKPLEFARMIVLQSGKELYVPIPKLQDSLLKKLIVEEGSDIKTTVSRWGIENTGKKIDIYDEIHIDLLVLGSVVVSKEGYRIGKGKGYADLEFALLKEMKAIDDNTVIVTIVHDSQVFETLPKELFKQYDVPVDYILTPTQIFKIENKPPRPEGIYWEILSQKRLNDIEVLRRLKKKHEENNVSLASDIKNENKSSNRRRYFRRSRSLKKEEVKSNGDATVSENNENIPPQRSRKRNRRFHIDFSLIVRNIEKNVRVRDLKKALIERGIKPYSITWKGYRGFCYLHYATKTSKQQQEDTKEPVSIDNVIEILQGLKITPDSKKNLNVKVMEPITRIETTDITSV